MMARQSSILENKVRSDVFDTLQKVSLKFNVSQEDLKKYSKRLVIKLYEENKDHKGPSNNKNRIYIPEKYVGNERAYIEEGTHFLRYCCSKQNDVVVHEFLAGIAVILLSDTKNLVFWKENFVDDLANLLEDERVEDSMREEIEQALDTMAGYDMASAFYKNGLVDTFLNTHPKIIYDTDQAVTAKSMNFLEKMLF